MEKNKFLLLLAFIAVSFIFLLAGLSLGQKGINIAGGKIDLSSPSNLLFLTSPITSFSGKVDKISGNSVWISQSFTLSQAMPGAMMPPAVEAGKAGPSPTALPTPITKVLTFKVNIDQNTQISRPQNYINYLLITVTPAPPPKLTVKDIKAGQMISINTNSDLRTLKSNEFTATSIQLPQVPNTINGKISAISGNTLKVKSSSQPAMMPGTNTSPEPPKEIEYTVTVTNDTEISRYSQVGPAKENTTFTPPEPEELALSDLKVDMQVTVYTDVDVTSAQKFTALRIEPFLPPPIVSLPPIAPPLSPVTPPPATTNVTTNVTTTNTTTNSALPKNP